MSDGLFAPRRIAPRPGRRWFRQTLALAWRSPLMVAACSAASALLAAVCAQVIPPTRTSEINLWLTFGVPLILAVGSVIGQHLDRAQGHHYAELEATLLAHAARWWRPLVVPVIGLLLTLSGRLLTSGSTASPPPTALVALLIVVVLVPISGIALIGHAVTATLCTLRTPGDIAPAAAISLAVDGMTRNALVLLGTGAAMGVLYYSALMAAPSIGWTCLGALVPSLGIGAYVAYRDIYLGRDENVAARVVAPALLPFHAVAAGRALTPTPIRR